MLTEIGAFCVLCCSESFLFHSFFSDFCGVSHNLSWLEYKSDSYAQLCNTYHIQAAFLQALFNSYLINYLVTTSTSWVKIFKVTLTWVNSFATLLTSAPGLVLSFAFLEWMCSCSPSRVMTPLSYTLLSLPGESKYREWDMVLHSKQIWNKCWQISKKSINWMPLYTIH